MGNKAERILPAPLGGAFLDAAGNPRAIPPTGAALLQNFLLRSGYIHSRFGTVQLGDIPDTKPIIDIFNVAFGTGAVEVIYHNRVQSYRFLNGAWSALSGATWTGDDTRRFWTVLAPFGATTKGKILMNNGIDAIRTWDGSAVVSLGASAVPARYAVMGDDGRLFTADTIEVGERRAQRVRWTTVALTEGDHTAWSATGSGALDLRQDPWKITALWRQAGRIFVGKERGIAVLLPTGITTDAYSSEVIMTNGEGVFAPHSVAQFGELVTFMSHRTINIFEGSVPRDILGERNRETLFRRLNYLALDQVTSVIDAERNRIGWGLPLDGASFPTEIWWYDLSRDAWHMDDFSHTALSIFTGVDITTIDELGGDINSLSGIIDNLSPDATAKGVIISGKSNGRIDQFNGSAVSDTGSLIASAYVSPALAPIGERVILGGHEHIVTEEDYFTLNEVAVTLLDFGTAYSVNVLASGDGVTFTPIGTVTIPTTGGTLAAPKVHRARVHARLGLGHQVQIKMVNMTTGMIWGFGDLAVKVDVTGQKR